MIDDPEEEAWRELERRIRRAPLSVREATDVYAKSAGTRFTSREEMERHFQAGWMAAVRNHRESND